MEIKHYRFQRITLDPEKCFGKPCIRGLRMPVASILSYLSSGMTIEEILAEWEAPEAHDFAFDMTYAWGLHHLMARISKGMAPASGIGVYLAEDARRYPRSAYRMNFTSNHDENSWNGTVYEVDVSGDGYVWQGKTYRSLTAIAQAITGTKWSGPRFFGLEQRKR